MKKIKNILFCLLLTSICNAQYFSSCQVDSGIKKATLTHTPLAENKEVIPQKGGVQLFYSKDGRLISVKKYFHQTQREYVFQKDLLSMIIYSRKKMPDFYDSDNEDSLLSLAPMVKDTSLVQKHDSNGRVKKIKRADGVYVYLDYYNCEKEVETTLASNGDTISQAIQLFKNGLLEQHTMVYLQDTFINKSFYGYKFNERRHWVERRYNTYKGIFIESRKLEYYVRRTDLQLNKKK